MSRTLRPTPDESPELQRLVAQLARLGAETRTERRVKRVLPWFFSLAIHLGLALVAGFITWSVTNRPAKEESALIVADFNAMRYDPVASMQQADDERAVAPAVMDLAAPLPTPDQIIAGMSAGESDPLAALDISGSSGESAAAALSRLAPSGGGHAVSFAGAKGSNAKKIVYAIDASGSMIAHIQTVIDELARSLANLSPQQSFAVIFFQGNSVMEVPPQGRLVPAEPAAQQRALAWMREHVIPRGGTNPLAAIERALKLKPDVVFLLSQNITGYGQFEIDQRDLLATLDKLNPADASGRRAVQINCIQFLDADPLDTMKLIAQQHGSPDGYKFLSRSELRIAGP